MANEKLFADDDDAQMYLGLLGRTAAEFGWGCMSYCLMTNHVHLFLETSQATLSDGMQWLHWRYAVEFNRRHGKRGHCFDGPFGSRRVRTQEQFEAVARYLPLNPVAAGLCLSPENWAWSSYGSFVRGEPPAWLAGARLLWYLGSLARYRLLVTGV